MRKKWRKFLVKLLIFVPIIGNIIGATRIKELENDLEKERNPSFEQAQQRISTRIEFSDWDFSEHLFAPQIKYWPTAEEALKNPYKVCSNGNFTAMTNAGRHNNFYMGLWNAKDSGSSLKSYIFFHGDGVFEFKAPLSEAGTYLLAVDYRGASLWFAFEVEKK